MDFPQGKLIAVIIELAVASGAADVLPIILVYLCLQSNPIKLAIPQKDDIGAIRDARFNSLHQLHMNFFRKVAFASLNHDPDQGQSALLVNDADHQRQTIASDLAAVNG
ncbi:MAG: hypothetical protein IPF56_10745 [Chloroflexi bacterium]|nr:hypothetical protein [Chloroflexota bacterium]